MDLATAFERLPKVELHCHVEGTMPPSTVIELADRNGVPLPTRALDDLYRYSSLDSFLRVFWLVQATLANRGDWARLAFESVLDGAAHGVVYREMFFTPARHLAAGQDLGEVVAGLDEGLAAGCADTGARTMLICDMDRAYGPRAAAELVERLVSLRRTGAPGTDRIIGVGLDSTEACVDPRDYVEAFAQARRAGLRCTSHQGEVTNAANIAFGVDVLGCQRIDHGLKIVTDLALMARFADERIPLTSCPTSNILIANAYPRLAEHPFRRMREAGLLATLNTDDPALIGIDLGEEYRRVAHTFHYGWEEMVAIALDGVAASWLDDADKSALARRTRAEADRLGAELAASS